MAKRTVTVKNIEVKGNVRSERIIPVEVREFGFEEGCKRWVK